MWTACCLGLVFTLSALADDAATTTAPVRIEAIFADEPLEEAVAILGMLSGTAIEIEGDVSDQRVSATLRDATLAEGLHQVLRELSYVVIRRTDGGITILSMGPANQRESLVEERQRAPGRSEPVPLGMSPGQPDVLPPTVPGTPGLSATDVAYYQSLSQKIDPDTVEVVPPDKAGGQGMTKAEFDALMAERPELSPSEIEVLPPTEPGGKGLTVAELEKLLEREQPKRSLADQVPPE
jgi:hypothetical protein